MGHVLSLIFSCPSYDAKRVIVREGHVPMCFYFILSGSGELAHHINTRVLVKHRIQGLRVRSPSHQLKFLMGDMYWYFSGKCSRVSVLNTGHVKEPEWECPSVSLNKRGPQTPLLVGKEMFQLL